MRPSLTTWAAARFIFFCTFAKARGFFEDDGAVRVFGGGAGNFLAEQFTDEFAERLVGRAVAAVVNVVLKVIHQQIGGSVTACGVAGEAVMQDVVELVVNARVERSKIGNRLGHDAMPRFLGR